MNEEPRSKGTLVRKIPQTGAAGPEEVLSQGKA